MQQEFVKIENTEIHNNSEKEYTLCLVYGFDQMVPVYLPGSAYVEVGDIVFFDHKEETIQANIKYVKSCSKDSDIWTAVTVATQMSPIKATKYVRMRTISWDIEEYYPFNVKMKSEEEE